MSTKQCNFISIHYAILSNWKSPKKLETLGEAAAAAAEGERKKDSYVRLSPRRSGAGDIAQSTCQIPNSIQVRFKIMELSNHKP